MTVRPIPAVICLLLTAASLPVIAAWPTWAPQFGDARNAAEWTALSYTNGIPGKVRAIPPPGEWHALTCTMWCRFNTTNALAANIFRTSGSVWCPEPVRRSGPDITAGAFGYPAGTNLVASASISCEFSAYAGGNAPSNVFPRGAYTIAGWSSNAVTLTLGGADVALGPGEFNRNALPGPSDGIVLTGSGPCAVGVAKIRPHQFFQAIDGVIDNQTRLMSPESTVTNELVFLAFRLRLDAAAHVYRADLYHLDWSGQIGQTQTNALPDDPAVRSLSSDGLYFFGLDGLGPPDGAWSLDIFDARIHARWLSDDDLDRIYRNGADEAARRQIPQWRNSP